MNATDSLQLLVCVSNEQICFCESFFHEAQMYSNDFGYEVDIFNFEWSDSTAVKLDQNFGLLTKVYKTKNMLMPQFTLYLLLINKH